MGKPFSMDLRLGALAAVDEGMSCRTAAVRFGVPVATVIRWHDQRRSTGAYAAKPQGEDTRSRRIEAHRNTVLALYGSRRDITLDELRRELSACEDWFDGQLDLDPERLVFIDETWTATNMTRSHGRCFSGRASADGLPAWPSQDDHTGRRAAHDPHGRADGARWPD